MSFKTNWNFLNNISMGAVGTEAVIEYMNRLGHQVIELERYCTSNKMWSTKIKRLRIPDLLCLRCGRRIESRAKSKLGIIMSDSKKPERRWFSGLRDTDLVAFVQCFKDDKEQWVASDTVNVFRIGDMKEAEGSSKTSPRKSPSDGYELDRRWDSCVPRGRGIGTIAANQEDDEGIRHVTVKANSGTKKYPIAANHYIYAEIGDTFKKGTKILSSAVRPFCDCGCSNEQYNFFADLVDKDDETIYTAVKALGYLPASDQATDELLRIAHDADMDDRIRLEAYASLLKLDIDVWEEMYDFAFSLKRIDLKTEYVLILGEIALPKAAEYLLRVLQDAEKHDELRAAAVWSIKPTKDMLSRVFPYCFSKETSLANHTIVKIKRHFYDELTGTVLDSFCSDDHRNAICAFLLSTASNVNHEAVVNRYLKANDEIKNWILYAIGLSSEESYSDLIERLDHNATETKNKLLLLWECHPGFMTSTEIDDISFIEKQR